MSSSRQRLLYSSIGLVLLVLLAGCAGFSPTDGEGPTDTPTVESDVDTSGDGLADQTAEQLDLNPDHEYDEQFVEVLQQLHEEDEAAARSFADQFATDGGLVAGADSTLDNYSTVTAEHPENVETINSQLLGEHSQEFADKQLGVLVQVDDDTRTEILDTYDLGDDDWSNSNLTNWEELHHGTDVLQVDTSGDGIPDGASVHQEDSYPGADPVQKDVYVEVNTVPGASISDDALQSIEQEFDNAPVENPDGTEGINIHFIENREISDDEWGDNPDEIDQAAEFNDLGYHYVVIVNQGDISDDHVDSGEATGVSYSSIASNLVESQGLEQSGSILMHELGHSLGLGGDLDGVDSRSVSFSQYRSVMNYNSPDTFFGFSDGSDSVEGTYDWQLIECQLAHTTYNQMSQFGDTPVPFNSSTSRALNNEVTPPSDCVFGFEITDQDGEYVFIPTDETPTFQDDEADIEEYIEEEEDDYGEDIEYTITDEPGDDGTVEYEVTITNNGLYDKTQTVQLEPGFTTDGLLDTQSEDVSLEPEESTTVTFELDADALRELGELTGSFTITTDDDRQGTIVGFVSDD